MAAGDAQRVWFPEMIKELTATWSSAMSWDDLRNLCSKMMELRRAIRSERKIMPPLMRCPRCGIVSRSDISGISIRSALFALKAAETISARQFETLDKSWRKHRSRFCLDAYGNPSSKRTTSERRKRTNDGVHGGHIGAMHGDHIGAMHGGHIGAMHGDHIGAMHEDHIGTVHEDHIGTVHEDHVGTVHEHQVRTVHDDQAVRRRTS